MAKKLGNDYLLWVESSTPGTFNVLKGQQTLSISRSRGKIDTSSKDNYPYGTSAPGLADVTLSLDIIPDLPDANGYTRFETLANAQPPLPVNVQIRKDGQTGDATDVVFQASMYLNIDSSTFGQNDAVKAKAGLTLAAAPTVDALA